ncbi:hypothetical protein ACIBQ3_20215 [Streptomyces rubiginosohelvolus]
MSVRRITPGHPRTRPAEQRRADLMDAAEVRFVDRLVERRQESPLSP